MYNRVMTMLLLIVATMMMTMMAMVMTKKMKMVDIAADGVNVAMFSPHWTSDINICMAIAAH